MNAEKTNGRGGDRVGRSADAIRRDRMNLADRVAKSSALHAAGNKIFAVDLRVADPARRERCRHSLVEFGKTYCAYFLQRPPSPRMVAAIEHLQHAIETDALTHFRWPRGLGKTTWSKIAVIWSLVYGLRHYVVLFGSSQELADALLDDIREFIETPGPFADDFPEIAVPVVRLQRSAVRCNSQRYFPNADAVDYPGADGKRHPLRDDDGAMVTPGIKWIKANRPDFLAGAVPTKIKTGTSSIRFASLPGEDGVTRPGPILVSRGITAAARGLVRGKFRPDFAMIDDPATDEVARSSSQCDAVEATIEKTILGLAGHTRNISAVMTSTTIEKGDLSDRFADAAKHPEWRTFTLRFFESWPDDWTNPQSAALWKHYLDLMDGEQIPGSGVSAGDAMTFYMEHRSAMDAGAEVVDDSAFDPRVEISAVQHAFNAYHRMKREGFMSEYQMEPLQSAAVFRLELATVCKAINGLPRGEVPPMMHTLVAAVDVMNGVGLRYVVTAFGPGNAAAVVDFGTYPGNGVPLCPPNTAQALVDRLVAESVDVVVRRLAAKEYRRGDSKMRVVAVGVDAGWSTKAVKTVCLRLKYSIAGVRIDPMRGVGCKNFRPLDAVGRPRSYVLGVPNRWEYQNADVIAPWLAFHADYFRETAQKAWREVPLLRDSLSLFKPSETTDILPFARECCAETLDNIDETKGGEKLWFWTVSGPNHYGDCVTMCYALAYWFNKFAAPDEHPAAHETVPASPARAALGVAVAAVMAATVAEKPPAAPAPAPADDGLFGADGCVTM